MTLIAKLATAASPAFAALPVLGQALRVELDVAKILYAIGGIGLALGGWAALRLIAEHDDMKKRLRQLELELAARQSSSTPDEGDPS